MPNIEVDLERYTKLLQSDKILNALYAGGVDNWEWYSESLRDAGVFEDDDEECSPDGCPYCDEDGNCTE